MQQNYKKYIRRCIDIALNGKGNTKTNPMVGCVIVHNEQVIGEGYHEMYGGPHAEVNAIASVKDKTLLKQSTLYVSLEPCAHTGKTPPCSDLIVASQIPKVVIGSRDPNSLVAGKGIEKLKRANIDVIEGVLEKECMSINNRFFTYHSRQRPYVILKWAESTDGFIDIARNEGDPIGPNWISNPISRKLVHKWRSEENAILVGTNTVVADNPSLTTRLWPGNSPIRVVIDRRGRLNETSEVFSNHAPTLVFTELERKTMHSTEYIRIDFNNSPIKAILNELWNRNIQSVIIEGGQKVLQSFIDAKAWDEARIFKGDAIFNSGIKAPSITGIQHQTHSILNDRLLYFRNTTE